MSLAIDLLRYEWQFAFRLWKDDSKLVDEREWVQQIGKDEQCTEREYMRERAAEILRLKKLEAKATELEAENAWLKAQLADCTQFDSPTWVNPAFEEFRARNWARINDPRK